MDNKLTYTLYSFIDLNYWWNNLDTEVELNQESNKVSKFFGGTA